MNREEVQLLGFEIVAYAGDARSKLLEAHKAQTSMLTQEASGAEIPYSITMMHGQDHLMTTILLKDVIHHLIELYKRGAK